MEAYRLITRIVTEAQRSTTLRV